LQFFDSIDWMNGRQRSIWGRREWARCHQRFKRRAFCILSQYTGIARGVACLLHRTRLFASCVNGSGSPSANGIGRRRARHLPSCRWVRSFNGGTKKRVKRSPWRGLVFAGVGSGPMEVSISQSTMGRLAFRTTPFVALTQFLSCHNLSGLAALRNLWHVRRRVRALASCRAPTFQRILHLSCLLCLC